MEFIKPNPTIDPNYKPSPEMNYLDYFYRAMVFAQTNYQEQLSKVANTQFRKLSPTTFFEEYAWCVSCIETSPQEVSKFFPKLALQLAPFYHCFWDLNNLPKTAEMKCKIISLNHDEKKFDAISNCAEIINRGIKLFGWDYYKNNFLNKPEKLSVLPMIGMSGACHLSRNIGLSKKIISSARLHHLVECWGFEDPEALCQAISKIVPLQLKIIELVLWYSVVTFETNICEA